MQLTLVVPAYNASSFIEESLASLMNQVRPGVEVIVVDDGSTDNTRVLIENKFSGFISDGSLKLITQHNQGVSAARNTAIDAAQGAYIGFMDADDFVLDDYIECILTALVSGADIIEFGFKTFVNSSADLPGRKSIFQNTKFGLNASSCVIDKVFAVSKWHPWSRVFKSSLFTGIRFPVGIRFCEDLMTVPWLYEKSKTIHTLPKALYGYRINPNGATLRVKPDYVENLSSFYRKIPRSGLLRHDYLRLATVFAIQSCNKNDQKHTDIDQMSEVADIKLLRYKLAVYRDINPKRILILLYPSIYKILQRLRNLTH